MKQKEYKNLDYSRLSCVNIRDNSVLGARLAYTLVRVQAAQRGHKTTRAGQCLHNSVVIWRSFKSVSTRSCARNRDDGSRSYRIAVVVFASNLSPEVMATG